MLDVNLSVLVLVSSTESVDCGVVAVSDDVCGWVEVDVGTTRDEEVVMGLNGSTAGCGELLLLVVEIFGVLILSS